MSRSRLPLTSQGTRPEAVTAGDWGLLGAAALMWGSSFVLIAIGVDHLAPSVVAAGRLVFGIVVLVLFAKARRPMPREEWPRVALLGVVWVGAPFLLFPIAQQWVDSSLAGVVNSSLPVFAAIIAAILLRKAPRPIVATGLALGFVGVVVVSGPTATGGGREALGVSLLVMAVISYAIAINAAVPLQQRYGSLPTVLHMLVAGLILVTPFALLGLPASDPDPGSILAVAALGIFGTGLAFVFYTDVLGRIGATRSSVVTYFFPVIAIVLGAMFRDEPVTLAMLGGAALILVGAWLSGRSEKRPAEA
ncbi:MAG: DMT family transporter [Thermoleophilia bacterium]|nr:DMT family transporter [Thermoleophilia bacterium]